MVDTDNSFNRDWDVQSYEALQLRYSAALKLIMTRMEILNDELQEVHRYNPIEHIKGRIKTPESIVKKLRRHGVESTLGEGSDFWFSMPIIPTDTEE